MEYRRLGETGADVSAIGFGGAPIGLQNYLTREDRDDERVVAQAVDAIREAVRLGVTYYDTAPAYGGGRSEHIFGRALEGRRDGVLLGTKFAFRGDRTPEEYTEALGESLDRLRTDCVDILQLHGSTFDDELAREIGASCVFEWLSEMKAEGLCRYAGVTAEAPSGGLERLVASRRFDVLQIAYNLIYQSACDYQRRPFGIIPFAKALGIGITTMRPTTCGFLQRLLGAEFPGLDPARLTRLAIRFVVSTPEVDCAIVGMRRPAEVRENVALAEDAGSRLDVRALHERYV